MMNLSRQTIATAGCLALFLLLGGARVAEAQELSIIPNPLEISVGEISNQLLITCRECDFPPAPPGFGRLVMSIDDTSVASLTLEEQLIQNRVVQFALTITGVGEGTTIVRVKLFRENETIPMLEEEVTVNVSPRCTLFPSIRRCCPVALLLDEDREQDDTLVILRRFRDEVMSQSATGRAYTRQFSRHAIEVSFILLRDPTLFEEVRETLLATLPTIEAVVNGERAMLTAENQGALDAVLDGLQVNASLPLQRAIHELRSDLHSGKRLRALGIEVKRGR